jgi:transposase
MLVRTAPQEDPTGGHLFAFIDRKRTQMKVLNFDRSGYCEWSKPWN